jgi:hypothetical protein
VLFSEWQKCVGCPPALRPFISPKKVEGAENSLDVICAWGKTGTHDVRARKLQAGGSTFEELAAIMAGPSALQSPHQQMAESGASSGSDSGGWTATITRSEEVRWRQPSRVPRVAETVILMGIAHTVVPMMPWPQCSSIAGREFCLCVHTGRSPSRGSS